MSSNGHKDPVLVIVQLTGGNDFMNTLVPYNEGHYYDARPLVNVPQDEVLPINDELGFNPAASRLKDMYDNGDVAVVQGIGYPNASRSHFRGMDILHTCEPDRISTEGWVAKLIERLDPHKENPLTGVNIGRGLPRAMVKAGVTATSVGDLDNYGLMPDIAAEEDRNRDLEIFKRMYTPAVGAGMVMDYLRQTGVDSLAGADVLAPVPDMYTSSVEYGSNPIAKALRDVARIHTAGVGTRVFYTNHAGYDTHSHQPPVHPGLLRDVSGALDDFLTDLREHDAAEEVSILVFTEFGRRMKDNSSGTDHGSGGGAFIIGDQVDGGLYAEYPSVAPKDWLNGEDLQHTIDFRGIYGTMLEQWMGVEPEEIVVGNFEQIRPFKRTLVAN
uniref:DUF1501 domain-containing protein n=1 Tax=uncultured microorganism TaxID=358574 RepID=E0X6P4_9ZZZZ|nr:protein of unknown function [uncultured microorganism]